MKMEAYVDEIKLALTGGVLELEVDDAIIQKIVNSALREVQRYICSTKLITIPFSKCIDLTEYKVNAVTKVMRATGTGITGETSGETTISTDPVQLSMFQFTSGIGNMYNFQNYLNNFSSWSTVQQIENTLSTDLAYYFEDATKKLYINTTLDVGTNITIEYVPRYDNVEEVTSDFWIDVIMRLSKALAKIYVGRIRSRFTQSNALWSQDGETLLNEGNTELTELRTYLQANTQLIYCYD